MKFYLIATVLLLSIKAQAFDLAAGLTPPSRQKIILRYLGLFHEPATFPTGNDAKVIKQNLSLAVPVYRTEIQSVTVSTRWEKLEVQPEQNNISNLYDIEFGASYSRIIDEKRMWAVSASYGSASDKPFRDNTVSTLGVTAFYAYPHDADSNWLLLVNYSNNRPILNNIPLPAFAYTYIPSPDFRLVVGAPFASIYHKFHEKFSYQAFALVPWVLKSSLNYHIAGPIQAYIGSDFSQSTYLPHGRENTKDRLFYDEKKLFIGFKSPLNKYIFFDAEIGHAFDRAFFVEENYEIDPSNPVSIGNAYFAKVGIVAMY